MIIIQTDWTKSSHGLSIIALGTSSKTTTKNFICIMTFEIDVCWDFIIEVVYESDKYENQNDL